MTLKEWTQKFSELAYEMKDDFGQVPSRIYMGLSDKRFVEHEGPHYEIVFEFTRR